MRPQTCPISFEILVINDSRQHQLPGYPRTVLGIPPFLAGKFVRQAFKALGLQLTAGPGVLRQGMNAAHVLGH